MDGLLMIEAKKVCTLLKLMRFFSPLWHTGKMIV